MSRGPFWGVLAPGEPARLERRARAILMTEEDEEDGEEQPFELIPGSGRYHAIVGMDPSDIGAEMQLAEALSLECDETVYSIERGKDPWAVTAWRNGASEVLEEEDPDCLAESLGCPLPGSERTPEQAARKPLRTVALIEGIKADEARRTLEEDHGGPFPPGRYRFEDTPRGLRISSETGSIGCADITLSERFPHAIVYAVMASPSLDEFLVTVMRGGEGVEEFSQPPDEFPRLPVVGDIKGERSPERILAALGIPPEWFRNE